uniref:Ribosomal RNA-processing protein 7 C-terminal domain-containing protein n=1 Tax=Parascaris univalens TaxID=6257 RepID=A0A915BVQ5_PARUN
MPSLKRAKKTREFRSMIDDKVIAGNNKRSALISMQASDNIVADVERNSDASNFHEKKQSELKDANLLPKKRRKHTEMNGDKIIKTREVVHFKTAKLKRHKKTDTESSLIVNKSKKFHSELAEVKESKGTLSETAEIERSEIDGQSASMSSNTTTTADRSFDPSDLRAIHYQLSDIYRAKRSLFLKGDASDPLSLLILNIPPFISLESVKTILEHTIVEGAIGEVILKRSMIKGADPNETYRVASVRFEEEGEVEDALRKCDNNKHVICLSHIGIDILPCGITKYIREYRQAFLRADELQKRVDSFFEVHDAKVFEEKQKAKKMHNVPDAEGWIKVTRSHFKPVPAAVVVKNKEDLLKLSKKKKRMKDNIPFYTFQLKQSKMKHLEELRKKFEEDKKKLALAKAARKFRPG